jgi:predicted acyl esterase
LKIFVPYHSYKKNDAAPLVPVEVTEIKFGLQPISVLLKKNHRLRVAIAGHDKGYFRPRSSGGYARHRDSKQQTGSFFDRITDCEEITLRLA